MLALSKRLGTLTTDCVVRVLVLFWSFQRVHRRQVSFVDLSLLTRCTILATLPRWDVMGRWRLGTRFRLYVLVLYVCTFVRGRGRKG